MNNQQQNQQPQASKTNAQKVRQQNAASAQGQSYNTEFASETNAQEVRQQNQQSAAKKQQATTNATQQQNNANS
ncbi:gamma-type small acid-soluble spore protein [Halalkalibacterium ligniniphilum]|uniref:gamma-type small acid-soluble spore protein n=1 Tax=Halalkalibacterium ligniniphilum TaxID=1134413 RepID=UPI000349A8A8|nr:gamma-type small acid-soluble spore protein [Halalkalibacterium ligniniphilum]